MRQWQALVISHRSPVTVQCAICVWQTSSALSIQVVPFPSSNKTAATGAFLSFLGACLITHGQEYQEKPTKDHAFRH